MSLSTDIAGFVQTVITAMGATLTAVVEEGPDGTRINLERALKIGDELGGGLMLEQKGHGLTLTIASGSGCPCPPRRS